jgi:eukaryotic-like serine/threonine-protein kinase
MSADLTAVHRGDILAGKYRVERVIGRGAMGIVVKAEALGYDEVLAVKFLVPEALAHEATVERFFREARATGRLTSEHVARVHDVGFLESGAPYMAMEYLEGTDFGDLLKRRGALPAYEAALYVRQACEALAEAHAAGIVHRDLKPANLFLTYRLDGSPCVKVLDFGISKLLYPTEEGRDLTLSNAVLGSPSYMSPEQIRSARTVDPRTDVWSLGVVLYQLVTGRLPFQAPNATDLITAVLKEAPPAPSASRRGLPLALDGVVLRCLEKDPRARYATVVELSAALLPFAAPSSMASSSASAPSSRLAPPRRPGLRRIVLAAAAVLLALALGAALLLR